MNDVQITVPASTSNLGPGFDCLGLAFDIRETITLKATRSTKTVIPPDEMVGAAADAFFALTGIQPFGFEWNTDEAIPMGKGLGSSAALRAGIIEGLNRLTGAGLGRDDVFRLCAGLEGHPDNAGPAVYGGFVVGRGADPCVKFGVDDGLGFVILVPAFQVSTPHSRSIFDRQIEREKAERTVANATRIVAAFAMKNYGALKGNFEDWLHQPARAAFVPGMMETIKAAEEAGALGGFLSGSGSSIVAVCLDSRSLDSVAAAMLQASPTPGASVLKAKVDNQGLEVTSQAQK